ncbi:MAG TPA: SPFH and helix-turn-helix domain-containing protein [Candidatus Polarisedimenticolaceae bacterium]|nr:SPFH and helix-turn-helix domain-containing protein [Candidatus Polarisedimenticolaceae bacterium]
MGVKTFVRGELIEIIEWTDATRDTLACRFPDEDRAIKRGAQLIVRESQVAQFVYLGQFGDTFGPGKHRLVTDNIPILTRLASWRYGLESPFKADVYFVNTRLFTGNKWGTSNPLMMRDDDLGVVRARAFGTYDCRVVDAKRFLREVAGSDHDFRLEEFAETMRSRLVSVFSDALATSRVPLLDLAARYTELGHALLPLINPVMAGKYGVEIDNFVVENVSVPSEVEQAIDKRSSMAAVGDIDEYVKFQLGRGLELGGGGAAGMASEMAVSLAIAQEMMQRQRSAPAATEAGASDPRSIPDLLSVEQVAELLGVDRADVTSVIESGELEAKRIGRSWRVKRSALERYLAD